MANKFKNQILELFKTKQSYAEIARIVGCTEPNVAYHCNEQRKAKVKKQTSSRIKKLNEQLKLEHGGCCSICGYSKCIGALHFHHTDPTNKHSYRKSNGVKLGMIQILQTYGMEEAQKEAHKCLLLCANCHAEVEAGLTKLV